MPDKIKRKALEEQERNRQPAKPAELTKVVNELRTKRKIEWVDPPLHDPNRKAEMIPIPNYTGGKAEITLLPIAPNEPVRMQNLPYLIDTKHGEEAETGGTLTKPPVLSPHKAMDQAEQAPAAHRTIQKPPEFSDAGTKIARIPELYGAVSPYGMGLAKIIALSAQKPDEANQLRQFMQTSEKDPGSPYYRPYALPTNKGAMDELTRLGIDTSNIDEKWFEDNAWLKQYVRLGAAGMQKVPTSQSSREETAAYYYTKLADSEGRTRKAEAELQGLKREIGYWAGRKDRNYSDEEILKRIDWNKYPTLTTMREGQQKGRLTPLNRAVDFDSDTVFGMLWSARNGKPGGSSTINAARYALGEGRQYEPDENVRAMRDPASSAYNPYALGSTVDEAAEYFGVDSFSEKWLKDNQGILKSRNETAIRHYQQVYGAEQATKAAEDETRKLSERIDARLNKAVSAGGAIDTNALLKGALFGLDTLQRMDEGLVSGDPARLTRPVNYRWQDVAEQVNSQAQVINARQKAPHDPTELGLAARNEEEKVLKGQGTLIQKDAVPRSYTSYLEKMPGLWAAGLTKDPLSAGWYVPAGGPDQVKAQTIADSRNAGDFGTAAALGYDALTGSGGDISKLSTHEGAVRMAIDLALDSAKAFRPEQITIPAVRDTNARHDAAVNSILGIDPGAVAKILPQILYATTVQGDISNQAAGTVGLMSSILRLSEGALKTVTDHVLGETPALQTAQTMFRMLKLRGMETGRETEAIKAAGAALLKTAGKTLQTAAAQTGHEELDDLTGIANQSSHNLDTVMKRWGLQGVNYIGNLLAAGRGDLAAAITAMPTYAKSAIVAETNMRTFGLNDDAIAAQENALKADMKSPIVIFCAKQIAKQQAVEARKAELATGGAFGVPSVLVQKINEAGKAVNQSKSALNQAVRKEQADGDALAKAQALFHKNMANTAVTDALAAAIVQLQKAIEARAKAQKELQIGRQSLNDAQRKLADTQKQAAATVDEQAKQDVDAMRMKLAEARAKLRGKAGGQAGEQGNVLPGQTQPGNVSNYRNFLANVHDNGIMETKSGGGSGSISEEEKSATPGELLTAVMTPEQLAGLPSYKEIVFSMLAEEQKQRANNGEDLFSIFDELGSGKQQQIEQMAQGIYDSLTSQQRKDLIFLGSSYAFAGESLDTRMKVLRWKEENQKEITYEDLVKMGFYTQGEMEDAGREWASLINAEYDQVYHKDTSIAMLDLEQGLQQGMERSMLFAMMAAPIIDRALYGPSDQIFANNIYDNLERQGTAENSKGSMGYIPPTMEENPGEPAMGMENPAGQASKGMTGRYIDNTTDTLTKGEKQVVDDLVRQGKTVERIPVNPKIEGGTPDFNVDGVRTELKTLENANTNTGMKRIQNGFSQGAENVIIDARNSGLTKAQADEVIARTKGKYPNGQLPGTVEIWIDGQVITYP